VTKQLADSIEIKPFDAKTATDDEWAKYHEYRRTRHVEHDDDEEMWPDAEVEAMMKRDDPFHDAIRFYAEADGKIVSLFGTGLMKPDAPGYESNAHLFGVSAAVINDYRRQGLGTFWLRKAVELMHTHDKTVLTTGSDEEAGHEFAKWVGMEGKLSGAENRLAFADVDWAMVEQWISDGKAKNPDTEIVFWENRVPEAEWETYTPKLSDLLNTMPFDDLDHGDEVVTPEMFAEQYARLDQLKAEHHTLITRETDGSISGMTDVMYFPQQTDRIFQQFTGVDPTTRGRGLGKLLKAWMLDYVRRTYPDVQMVITGNAHSNDPMLAINHKLGFKEHRAGVSYQMSRDDLDAFVAQLATA
jgi:GNAT superfamily N-acetyltransferase